MRGAYAAVAALAARGVPLAIATSSTKGAVALKRVAHEAAIFRHVSAVIDINDVEPLSKPHPRCFLLAAERLGVAPTACVAVEDSIPGITAAVAAGCTVVAPLPLFAVQGCRFAQTSCEWPKSGAANPKPWS